MTPNIGRSGFLTFTMLALAQVMGTSVWFAPGAAAEDLRERWGTNSLTYSTLATQAGFVIGTLVFALTGLADRFPANRIFAISAVLASASTWPLLAATSEIQACFLRLATGACLAGVYPLGMKLVVSWFPDRTPQALAWLVGALVLGTASPFLLRALGTSGHAERVISGSCLGSIAAALMVLWVGDGPHLRRTPALSWNGLITVIGNPDYRTALAGYLGHMVELYAFWALVPVLARSIGQQSSLTTFGIIAMGAAGCVAGGQLALKIGASGVAQWAMVGSAACGLAWPWLVDGPSFIALTVLILWGTTVVADSPQFSAMASKACPPDAVGSGLTLQVCLGFALTMPAIGLMGWIEAHHGPWVGLPLAVGPILGIVGMKMNKPRG